MTKKHLIMIKSSSNPDEIIKEWCEWEGLPEIPEPDENEVINMKYQSDFQEVLRYTQKSKERLKKEDYTKILVFQSRLVLFLFLKDIDFPNLNSLLIDLRNLCIWEENSQKINKTLSSISTFLHEIDNHSSKIIYHSKDLPKPNKNNKEYQSNKPTQINIPIQNTSLSKSTQNQKQNNLFYTNEKTNYNSTNINTNTIQTNFGNSMQMNKIKRKPLKTVNPFQSLAEARDPYENRKEREVNRKILTKSFTNQSEINESQQNKIADKILKHLDELERLLNYNNGIVDNMRTKEIFSKICQIQQHNPYDQIWKSEVEYFQNRKMVPLQHIVYLRSIINDYY